MPEGFKLLRRANVSDRPVCYHSYLDRWVVGVLKT